MLFGCSKCCGGSGGGGCTCQCDPESPPPNCLTLRVTLGTVTSSSGPTLSSTVLAKYQNLVFSSSIGTNRNYNGNTGGDARIYSNCWLVYALQCLTEDQSGVWSGSAGLGTTLNGADGLNGAADAGYGIDRNNAPQDGCEYWFIKGNASENSGSNGALYFQSVGLEDFFSTYSVCNMSGQKTLHFWTSNNRLAEAKITVGTTVLNYANATFTIEPGCGVCGCGNCETGATLNDGSGGAAVFYPCVPPSVTISLENVTTTEGGLPGNDTATLDAVKAALDGLPGVVCPLVRQGSTTAGCNTGWWYEGTYSLGSGAGTIYFTARLYCDKCANRAGGIGIYYGSVFGYSWGSCVAVSLVPSTLSPWIVTTGHAISALSFGASGLWANAGAQIPNPTLSIKTICSGGGSTGVYDATSAQDLGPAQVEVSGYSGFAGTLYFTEATITVSVP